MPPFALVSLGSSSFVHQLEAFSSLSRSLCWAFGGNVLSAEPTLAELFVCTVDTLMDAFLAAQRMKLDSSITSTATFRTYVTVQILIGKRPSYE